VRKGFTFIELVVAIVVIGIAMMSIPLMLSQATRSNEFSINQEVILASSTKIGNILSFPWDDKLVGIVSAKPILDVTKGDSELNRFPNQSSTRRIGNFKANYRRKFDSNITYASSVLGQTNDNNASAFNDMDDFNGTTTQISSGGNGDYIKGFTLTTTVNYISDKAIYSSSPTLNFDLNTTSITDNNTTNIKMVEVKATDANGNTITTLRAFSTNIGSYELIYRIFN